MPGHLSGSRRYLRAFAFWAFLIAAFNDVMYASLV
jgi:hypothetical protein